MANNLNTSGQLDATDGLTGAVPVANGGTGLTSVGTSGNVLTSNGSVWTSTAIPAPTIADGSVTDPKIADGITAGTRWIPLALLSTVVGSGGNTTAQQRASGRVLRGGTYRFKTVILNNAGVTYTYYFRIYQDGVALGTETALSIPSGVQSVVTSSDVTLTSGGIVQFYFRTSSASGFYVVYGMSCGVSNTLKTLPITIITAEDNNSPNLAITN